MDQFLKFEIVRKGIISNRKSDFYGEHVIRLTTHRPSHTGSWVSMKVCGPINVISLMFIKIHLNGGSMTGVKL
jgi:hypothetical protein